jgi:hypothetical protein
MDQRASFETRAVLAPRRARLSRLAVFLPVVALVAIAWVGVSGTHPNQATAAATAVLADPTIVAAPTPTHPAEVLGLDVLPLADVRPRSFGRDELVIVAGWYVTTAITDCPPLAAIYRDGALPYVRGDADEWTFCDRSGLLYASRPDPYENAHANAWIPAVGVSVMVGVIMPLDLETIGGEATEVVVIGRFIESGDGCRASAACSRELAIDHVAWTPGA